jgi:hypothetical protein
MRQAALMGRDDQLATELVAAVNGALPNGVTVNSHDILSIRRAHRIDHTTHPEFVHRMRFGSPQYSDTFADWIVQQHAADRTFFQQARDRYYDQTHRSSE